MWGLLLTLLTSLLFPLQAQSFQKPLPYSIEGRLLRQFEQLAFYTEFGGPQRQGRLVKWDRPILVTLTGPGAAKFHTEIEAQIEELRRLSGLFIQFVAFGDQRANMNIFLYYWKQLEALRGSSSCYLELHDRRFRASKANIYIPIDNAAERKHCIVEELTQGLGLTNDTSIIQGSIFNDNSWRSSLHSTDEYMVSLLYDKRLIPGMTVAQAYGIYAPEIKAYAKTIQQPMP